MALKIERLTATTTGLVIYFSERIGPTLITALKSASLIVVSVMDAMEPAVPGQPTSFPVPSTPPLTAPNKGFSWAYDSKEVAIFIMLASGANLTAGSWIKVGISGWKTASAKPVLEHPVFYARVEQGDGDPDGKPRGGGRPNGHGDARDISDLQSFAVLTQEMPSGGPQSSTRSVSQGLVSGTSALGMAADKAIREVLSWRTKADDSKGFIGALNQAFDLKQVEGHTEWSWTPRSYTVQTDMGAVTGAQASIYTRAKVALDQCMPLLDGLYALYPYVEPEDLSTAQSVVRSQFTSLVNEFGVVGGPRVPRVDELFELLLGQGSPTNPEHLKRGSLFLVKQRFGMERRYVVSVEDEQNLTNYLIMVDYVIGLKESWKNDKNFFIRGGNEREPFFGTQLVLISRALDVVAQGVQDAYFAMDSVFMADAERQTALLSFRDLTIYIPYEEGSMPFTFPWDVSSLYVAELLDWVDNSVSTELPALLQDAGKDALSSFRASTDRLRQFVHGAANQAHDTRGLPPGFHTPRVKRALKLLADGLDEAYMLALQVHRDDVTPQLDENEKTVIRRLIADMQQ